MPSELIPFDQAAAKLGVSAEKLTEMLTKKEVFGFRDGASWKFKISELERVAEEMGVSVGGISESDDEYSLSDSGSPAENLISDLDTPVESESAESDVLLEASDDMLLADSGELKFDESGLASVMDDDLLLDDENASGTGKLGNQAGDELSLMDDELFEEDELSLQDSAGLDDGSDLSSDFADSSDVVVDDSDSNALEEDMILDEEDLVVSEAGSDDDDFALSDSGILSLDDLDGNADDFDLEPVDEMFDDQSSSSQVIALEDSDLMDESNATMLLGNQSGDLAASDDFGGAAMPLESFDGPMNGDQMSPAMIPAMVEEPFSIYQILSLTVAFFTTGGLALLALNLAQNMWQPAGSSFDGTLANWLVELMQFNS